jgi:hypothetical protein
MPRLTVLTKIRLTAIGSHGKYCRVKLVLV